MLLRVDCLPNAVGKQPSIPLIYLGGGWTLNWWWWWWWWTCFMKGLIVWSINQSTIVGQLTVNWPPIWKKSIDHQNIGGQSTFFGGQLTWVVNKLIGIQDTIVYEAQWNGTGFETWLTFIFIFRALGLDIFNWFRQFGTIRKNPRFGDSVFGNPGRTSKTPGRKESSKCLVQLYSPHYMPSENPPNCFISSRRYVLETK